MLRRLFSRTGNTAKQGERLASQEDSPASVLSQRELVNRLLKIPFCDDKIKFYDQYDYSPVRGRWTRRPDSGVSAEPDRVMLPAHPDISRIHYGCGDNLIDGWLNIDRYQSTATNYVSLDLLEKHPFPDRSVRLGFSEDMLEHLTQAESIFFISEVYRTLEPAGVLRLSFPGLEGVLAKHYAPFSETRVRQGEFEAYSFWDHVHFYSKDELALVATHIGFGSVEFVDYGQSKWPELCKLDTRSHQIGLNTYAELTK
jgi:predicted SAM-dependent methyltransferase